MQFVNECVGFFVAHGARTFKPTDSTTALLYELLRNSTKGSVPTVKHIVNVSSYRKADRKGYFKSHTTENRSTFITFQMYLQ